MGKDKKDKQEGQEASDDKSYLVDQQIDSTLSKEEKNRLKTSREEADVDEEYLGRQDIFSDRRDSLRDDYSGEERRSGEEDRRKE